MSKYEKLAKVATLSKFRHKLLFADLGNDSDDGQCDGGRCVADIDDANLISSEFEALEGHHSIALDIDIPCHLEPSSTPGHHHLYIDTFITWEQYERLLDALVECKVIEPGYAAASIRRKATHLRLPWVKKGQERE